MLVLAVLIHEGGHILAARLAKAPLTAFTAGPQGFSLAFDFSALSYGRECFVLLSGSAAGLLASALAFAIDRDAAYFSAVSAVLSLVNLLPVKGLDGGAALSCVLSCFLLPDTVCRITGAVSLTAALLFWMAAVWIQLRIHVNLSLLAAALYFILRSTAD